MGDPNILKQLQSWLTPGGATLNGVGMGATMGQRLRDPDRSTFGDNSRGPQPNAYPHKTGVPESYGQYPDPYLYNTPGRTDQTIPQEVQGARRNLGADSLMGARLNDQLTPAPTPSPWEYPQSSAATSAGTRSLASSPASSGNPMLPMILKMGGSSAAAPSDGGSGGSGGSGYSGGGASGNSRYLGLPEWLRGWAQQFEEEHRGTPFTEYYGGQPEETMSGQDVAYALDEALWDKQWGDKFYDTYHRAPSDDDWKASYYDRNSQKYRGESPWGGDWQGGM